MARSKQDDLLAVLSASHIGQSKSIGGAALAARLDVTVRTIRALVRGLREDAVAVCGSPETGYFIAETSEELEGTCKLLETHGIHQLEVAARMRKTTLPELLGQMKLST